MIDAYGLLLLQTFRALKAADSEVDFFCLCIVIVPNNKTGLVSGLIEKPNFENAPSNLASIDRYVLTPDIFDILRNQSIGVGREIQLADSINVQAENNKVETVLLNGKRFDCGDVQGYVEAIKYVASNYKFD